MPTRCACLMNFSAHLLMHCTPRHSYKFCDGHQVTSGACAQSQSAVASHMSFRRRVVARTCPMALICMCAAALTCMLAQNARAFCAASRHAWGTSTDRHIVAVVWKPHPLLICVELSSSELTHAVAEAALCQAIVQSQTAQQTALSWLRICCLHKHTSPTSRKRSWSVVVEVGFRKFSARGQT